ncbi:class I SAM-dependent methyltransferase [Kaistia dalseonensis]|uniref:SAM-dependent methyltransferase n=1 Tax=Kaistia dalseonensis TaxID=410840 RepID=A0ABU0H4X5_9HYPH|nr:class I SAM-dependent methyltransferase [Kaistia dalseonensis]MCX5494337.1 class I SAM-dependent methyltransferase [Kaistia dalseonensis]MDQ0436918.1 SAM-dependent methyltransferase [Kaistia dalseonensis]
MSQTSTQEEQTPPQGVGHDALVVQQFGTQASAYVASLTHAGGDDIGQLAALIAPGAKVLDLGCGGGHVSYAAAAIAGSVTAYDLSSDMLAAVRAEAAKRGIGNLTTVQGPAETLPFPDASFDVVLCRYSAHHWQDVRQGVREARRVLKPNGVAGFADAIAPESAVLDTFLQTFEMLRDPSHVRDYTAAEWVAIASEAGFGLTGVTRRRLWLDFDSWIGRMRTPKVFVDAIRALQAAVSDPVRAHFEVQPNGTFTIDTAVFELKAL